MNDTSLFSHDANRAAGSFTASKDIFALELVPASNGSHSGGVRRVPKGANLQVCGNGFNERTIQVRWEGRLCFVFLQDVGPLEGIYSRS
jgi:hypothetical protein